MRRTLQALGAEAIDSDESSPVFVGGTWDAGVRSLQGALDAHSNLEAGEESKLIPIICSLRNEWWSGMAGDLEAAGIGEPQLDDAVRGFIKGLLGQQERNDAPRQVETTPHTFFTSRRWPGCTHAPASSMS